jgi:hypothetical protein
MPSKCKFEGCDRYAIYNKKGERKRLYCIEHKENEMVDVVNKRCKFEGCDSFAIYNTPGEKSGLFCIEHKTDDMDNVVSKRCKFKGCNRHAIYNKQGETKRLFCIEHKTDDMIDVVHKRCKSEGCDKYPIYNKPGETKGLFCLEHIQDGMIDIVSKRCKNDWCETLINPKYEGYCAFCFSRMFPDNEKSRNYKTKEIAVRDYILERYPDFTWICDKTIQDGCSKKRPDLLLDLGYQVIIIEVDENQHTSYDSICENKRLMELSKDINHRNLIFIRFNPDSYKTRENKTIKSCWKIDNRSGIWIISNKTNWNTRLTVLEETLKYWINNETNKMIEIVELFFDGFE